MYPFNKVIKKLIKSSHVKEYKICDKCNYICDAKLFQQNFGNWTSGNNEIDKFIQDTQLSAHDDVKKALEWIPHNRLYNIKYIAKNEFGKKYRANWIDGNINNWNVVNQIWERINYNMFVILVSLNNLKNLTQEFKNKIKIECEFYGITQDPETKNYIMVLNNKCKKCNSGICNIIYFQHKFIDWTSGNNDIDKFIQETQKSVHKKSEISHALEWIPYDRLYDIKYIAKDGFGKAYRANWIDGYITYWNIENKNWKRKDYNMFVILKSLNTLKNLTLEIVNEIKLEHEIYGITQDLETENYMMVLNNKCKMCNGICYAIHFQHKFIDWTSGNNDIDKFIQDTQLSTHGNIKKALEWIPYGKLYDITYFAKDGFGKVSYGVYWIDGYINNWNNKNQNWKRKDYTFVFLKSLNKKNLILEVVNKINMVYGITQDPETKNYMMVLSHECKKCNSMCNIIHFQHKFIDWTSGNNDIDKFIQDTQLSVHKDSEMSHALEWIPYDRLKNFKYAAEGSFGKVYRANWIDGYMANWNSKNQDWKRKGYNMFVILKSLNIPKNLILEIVNETKIEHEIYGITQDPETKNYMIILNNKCKMCNSICYAIYFQHKFIDWTSGNNDIDKFIQDTQLSVHKDSEMSHALEWIPYSRLDVIKYVAEGGFGKVYRANWIDGYMANWNSEYQDWKRKGYNMFVILKSLSTLKNLILEIVNEIKIEHEIYGITQDPETKNYMMVLNNKCKICKSICYAIYFQYKFIDWTSGNNDIDKFIQNTQLSVHKDSEMSHALEWIPYGRFEDIKYIAEGGFSKVYRANWIDGCITNWNSENQNWKRYGNRDVILKGLNNLKIITKFTNNEVNISFGITQDPETKNYMMVLNNKFKICKTCNGICHAIYFQYKFMDWTSGNNDIDKFIQDIQKSAHYNVEKALEWIPYDRLYDIKYIAKDGFDKVYRANWIDGYIVYWNSEDQNWLRKCYNMYVILKDLNTSKNLILGFVNKIKIEHEFYGITQDPETKNYMMVLNNKCKMCKGICYAIHFQHKFMDWTSGNNDIDKFIQDTQKSVHKDSEISHALEWIPYDRLYDIEYIAKGGFGKVYRATWIDSFITNWNSENQNWKRYNENMFVALKSLDNSKNVTSEFMNEIMLHNKVKIDNNVIVRFYGITQDPKTKNYMMVLDYAEDGSLRNYLDKEYKLNWDIMFEYLQNIIVGLKCIHEKEFIHRDLHIGNILKFKYKTAITDLGLCKPANLENAKTNIYGVLPYIAPEILRGQNYTKAGDIYSFGIIMYEVISGLPPYHDLKHDNNLAIKICKGLRPRFNIKVTQLIVHLIKRCLDANPLNRPIAKEIIDILFRWQYESSNEQTIELRAQIKEADELNNNSPSSSILTSTNLGISYNTHSEAIYTSRLLDFNNLPVPKNSDDYYEQNNNIISEKFSESLQIDISQLNIN
ncbi:unnamed protein product [Rhizophagus irregularis]|nr:unnamed protein product [Rhizophagus irregularis]